MFPSKVADETFWLEEKLPLAGSTHLGNSLSEVQSLQQKHQLLETEIQGHEKAINGLGSKVGRVGKNSDVDVSGSTKFDEYGSSPDPGQ